MENSEKPVAFKSRNVGFIFWQWKSEETHCTSLFMWLGDDFMRWMIYYRMIPRSFQRCERIIIKAVQERESGVINLRFGDLRCKSGLKAAVSRSHQQLVDMKQLLVSFFYVCRIIWGFSWPSGGGISGSGDFPTLASCVLRQLNSFKSHCLKSCPGGSDPSMAAACLLVCKVKVKTTGSKREDVWLSSESIAFPLLPPFDAVEPRRRPWKVQHDWSSCGAT